MLFKQKMYESGSVARSGVWLASEKIILLGKGLLLTYFLANWLLPEVYGTYQFILSFLGTLSVFVLPGMGVAIVQAIARNKAGTFAVAIKKVSILALWGTAILSLVGLYYYFFTTSVLVAYLYFVLAVSFPGYSVMNFWRYYYTGQGRFSDLVKVSVFLELLSLGFMLVAILFFRSLEGLVLLGILAPIPPSLFIVWRLFKSTRIMPADHDSIVFGQRISFAISLSSLVNYGDKVLVGMFLGFSEVAMYSVASIIPEQAKSFAASFVTPLLPKYSESVSLQELNKHLAFTTFSSIGLALVLYAITPTIFTLVFPNYLSGIEYAQWMLVGLCSMPVILLETYFRSQKDDVAVVRATVISSLSNLFLLLVLVPKFGIIGAVAAKLGGSVVQGAMYWWSYRLMKSTLV